MNRTFGSTVFVAASFALAIGLSPRALAAGDSAKEAQTAAAHAGMASSAANIATAHAHLHHTVNCLVGPKGDGYDATQANPCAQMGGGAIPDATDAAAKAKMTKAVETAQAGIKSDDLATATKAGSDAAADLK